MAASKPLKTIVTMLEMTARPRSAVPLPLNRKAALMRANGIPLHYYRYLMYRTGRPWHWVIRLRMEDDELRAIVHAQTTEVWVLYVDGSPAGFFEIDRKDPAATDLAYFGLMEHAIGTGLGRWFLSSAIDACWENGPDKVTVNTCTLDHPSAIGLYQKLGFVPVGRRNGEILPLSDEDHVRLAKAD